MLVWTKCTVGGWVRGKGVYTPGFISAEVFIDGKKVAETHYPSYEKKIECEAFEAAQRAEWLEEERRRDAEELRDRAECSDLAAWILEDPVNRAAELHELEALRVSS